MKKTIIPRGILSVGSIFLTVLMSAPNISGADNPRLSYQQQVPGATAGMQAAEQELKTAGEQFNSAAPLPQMPVDQGASRADGTRQHPIQQSKTRPLSQVPREPAISGTGAPSMRQAGLIGTPETGFAGTWTDPANGDEVTTVVAPSAPPHPQSYPVYIEPQIYPSDWANGNWNNNGNSGWQPNSYPQWPGYPGDSGYMPPPPSPPLNSQPPVMSMPSTPGYMPHYPPPAAPGYRPLRPDAQLQPPAWGTGNPGVTPGGAVSGVNSGLAPNHGPVPNNPGFRPNPGYQPGYQPVPGANPGFPNNSGYQPSADFPNQVPGFRPLPMRPGGTTWDNSPFSSQQGGGMFRGGGK